MAKYELKLKSNNETIDVKEAKCLDDARLFFIWRKDMVEKDFNKLFKVVESKHS
tara:strand:+ start:181 stop:342 length:162 start_codon:yes stop_codon:yes gene_type:complete